MLDESEIRPFLCSKLKLIAPGVQHHNRYKNTMGGEALCCRHGSACRAIAGCAASCGAGANASAAVLCTSYSWLCPSCYAIGQLLPSQARCCVEAADCAIDIGRMGCKDSCGSVARANATFSERCYGMRHLCPWCYGDDPAVPRLLTGDFAVGTVARMEVMPLAFSATLILRRPRVVLLGGYAWLTASWVANRVATTRSAALRLDDPLGVLLLTACGIGWGTAFGAAWGARSFISGRSKSSRIWGVVLLLFVVGTHWLGRTWGLTPTGTVAFLACALYPCGALPAPTQQRGFPRQAFWSSSALTHAALALLLSCTRNGVERERAVLVLAAVSSAAATFARRQLWDQSDT